jgi:hypothetical protein
LRPIKEEEYEIDSQILLTMQTNHLLFVYLSQVPQVPFLARPRGEKAMAEAETPKMAEGKHRAEGRREEGKKGRRDGAGEGQEAQEEQNGRGTGD